MLPDFLNCMILTKPMFTNYREQMFFTGHTMSPNLIDIF